MYLIHNKTGNPVRVGDVVHYRQKPHFVKEMVYEGKVWIVSMDELKVNSFVSEKAIGCEWVYKQQP